MKQYTIGKKAAVIVLHQLCMILMVTGVFATGYAFRHDAHENIDIYTLISLAGLVGSFVSLAYMANVAGRKSEDDYTIYYLPIDKVYSDVMLVIFTLLMVFMGKVISGVKNQHFDYASLIMTAGTFTFLFDLAFIILYQSIVRKIKGNILYTHSLMYKGYELLKRVIEKKDIHTQKNKEIMRIQEALEAISEGALDTTLNVNEFHGQQKKVAEAVNHIRQGLMSSVNESLKNEKLKADLITNVSHDIKTPLTSIVNYVDLLKRENLENENAKYYIHVLEEKSQRLKQLTEDLVETSKITSGNVKLNMQKLDLVELLYQTGGEFNERFESRNLTIVTKIPSEQIFIYADGRQLYRSIENLYTNAAKYALENTRVYVELEKADKKAVFTIKNVSKNELDIVSNGNVDLTERFVSGVGLHRGRRAVLEPCPPGSRRLRRAGGGRAGPKLRGGRRAFRRLLLSRHRPRAGRGPVPCQRCGRSGGMAAAKRYVSRQGGSRRRESRRPHPPLRGQPPGQHGQRFQRAVQRYLHLALGGGGRRGGGLPLPAGLLGLRLSA